MGVGMDSKEYLYDAFISYSHLDKREAAAFQRRLERFRIPRDIRMKRGIDSARLKICRDETDLPAGSLTGAVYEALDASRKLIVICSSTPAAEEEEKYGWVMKEVQHFIDAERQDDILPVLLDGDWEAMPGNLKLLQREQFISDVLRLGRRTAFLKILSGVLGIDFDALVRRDRRRRRMKLGALAACCCVLSALCLSYFCPQTAYYADYTVRFGKPEGIQRLTHAQRAVRSESFAITTTRSRREIRLEHMNSAGLVSTDTGENHLEKVAAAVYDCLENGQINTVTYLDETGKLLYTHAYAPDLSYLDIIRSKDDARWLTLPAESGEDSLPVRTNISRYQLQFDEDGFLRKRIYAVDRLPAVDETGIGGKQYEYDQRGRLSRIAYLDTAGNPDVNRYGIAGERFSYDDGGHVSRIEYYGEDGGLAANSMKYAAAACEYDGGSGNLRRIRYYDESRAPVITARGYAEETREYDKRGFLTACAYFDDLGQPVRGPRRFHRMEIVPDRMGRDAVSICLDTDGSRILTPEHYAKCVKRYNARGLTEDVLYYGEDGHPNLSAEGSCRVHFQYDARGNLTEISHYGLDERLIFSSRGYAVMKLTYNEDGLQETECYFGVKHEPIPGREGYHEKRYVYDSRNNIHEIRLMGTMGQPALCADGYALRVLEYDNAGNIESDACFDDYGQPAYREGSYSKAVMKYDQRGRRTLTERLNPDGTPADLSSYTSEEVKYDDMGREEERVCYLLDEPRFMQEYEYQGSRLSVRTDYLTGSADGLRTVHRYDEKGRETETDNYEGSRLSNRSVGEFDTRGNMVKGTFYDARNKEIRCFVSEYNRYGLPTKTSYYDADGQLSGEANTQEHVAVVISEYDERNLKTERRCYDEAGRPARIVSGGKEAYARLVMEYDRNGNCINSVYYDENGTVYQSIVQTYDAYNRELDRIYLDGEENQLVRKEVRYDALGNTASCALYDRKDRLQAEPGSGVAKIVYTRDRYGYVIGEEFYGDGGRPTAPYGTYHKYRITRSNGRSTEIRYYGTDGRPDLNQDGYAVERFTYDKRGNVTGCAFFGADDKPVLLRWRFSRYEVRYDDKGNLTESRFFDTAGREVRQVDGHLDSSLIYINGVPRRILIFIGNDGTSLMGEVEMKLYIPLQEFVKPEEASPDTGDAPPADEELPEGVPAGEEEPPREAEPEEEKGPAFMDREYISAVNDYVRAVERFEGTGIMDLMEQSLFNATADLAARQLGVEISAYKIYHFYADFYSGELAALKASLEEKYGSGLYITYEILSEEYWPADQIPEANQAFHDLGAEDFELQEMVTLDVAYTVSGSKGQGSESSGFLSRQLVLMKVKDRWKLGAGENFPSPSAEQVMELYRGQ